VRKKERKIAIKQSFEIAFEVTHEEKGKIRKLKIIEESSLRTDCQSDGKQKKDG
jgi:hypothetical protein